MQIFNQLNCRRVDNQLNILEGITNNPLFFLITAVIVAVQFLLIFFGGKALNTVPLSRPQWGCSILMGACTLPVGAALRYVPDIGLRMLIPDWLRLRLEKRKKPDIISDFDHWDDGMLAIKDELSFTKKIRGGRLRGVHSTIQRTRDTLGSWSPRGFRSRDASPDGVSIPQRRSRSASETAVVAANIIAGIVAGCITGWGPNVTNQDIEAATPPVTTTRKRTSGVASVSGMSETSLGSRMRRRPMSRSGSIGSAISVPGVVAGAIAVASPSSEKSPAVGAVRHEKSS